MTDKDWNAGYVRCLGVRLDGEMIDEVDVNGRPIVGETLLLLLNAHHRPIPFALPTHHQAEYWRSIVNTAHSHRRSPRLRMGQQFELQARSMAVFQLRRLWPKFLAKFIHNPHLDVEKPHAAVKKSESGKRKAEKETF